MRRPRIWRLAPDPRAEGVAIGQYIVEQGVEQRPRAPRSVAVLPATDAAGRARLAGLRGALARGGLRMTRLRPGVLRDGAALIRALDADRRLAVVLDGAPRRVLATALRRAGDRAAALTPASIVVRAGLRGFVAGRALGEGLRDGTDAGAIAARLRRPRRFTDALNVPWRSDAPAAGAPLVGFLAPRFLPSRRVPVAASGERFAGRWFADGSWQPSGTHLYGPPLPGLAP